MFFDNKNSTRNFIFFKLWDSSLAKVGDLTKQKSNTVSNSNLAKFCDRLGLFEYKISRVDDKSSSKSKEETIKHEKGTLVEAIFGVIYLEHGLEELGKIIPILQ